MRKKEQNYSYLLKIKLHPVITITNTQNKVHYAYLFFSCGKFQKIKFETMEPHFLK